MWIIEKEVHVIINPFLKVSILGFTFFSSKNEFYIAKAIKSMIK